MATARRSIVQPPVSKRAGPGRGPGMSTYTQFPSRSHEASCNNRRERSHTLIFGRPADTGGKTIQTIRKSRFVLSWLSRVKRFRRFWRDTVRRLSPAFDRGGSHANGDEHGAENDADLDKAGIRVLGSRPGAEAHLTGGASVGLAGGFVQPGRRNDGRGGDSAVEFHRTRAYTREHRCG